MACIEGGAFVNGEAPQAERTVGTYWLDTTEVTVAAYDACVTAGSCTAADTSSPACNAGAIGREQHPINCVDWFQADAYCTWAGKRLPDEWEWEWAARGRDDSRSYPWGEDPATCARAVMSDPAAGGPGCGAGGTGPVGSKPAGASRDGVLDLAGNALEWTASWFDASEQARVARGGGWGGAGTMDLSVDARTSTAPTSRGGNFGFRCARTP